MLGIIERFLDSAPGKEDDYLGLRPCSGLDSSKKKERKLFVDSDIMYTKSYCDYPSMYTQKFNGW